MLCDLQGFTKRVPKIVGTLLALLFPAIKPERRERKETVREFKVSVGGFSVQDQARDNMWLSARQIRQQISSRKAG